MKDAQKKAPEVVWFKLSEPHRHRREDKQPGDVIPLRPDQAERLAKLNRGEVVPEPKPEARDV